MRKDRGSRTKKQWNQRKNLKCVGWGPWLSLLPQTVETLQVRQRDVSLRCHCDFWPSSLAQEPESHLCPLHYLRGGKREEKRKRRKFYIYPDVTHTHTPGRAGENPERQEEEKSGHTTGRRPKTAQGGRGTDGPPEPTYTAKRTWQKQRTHLNPTTHYGEASRRVIRDQWGLVGEKKETTKKSNRTQFLKNLKVVRYSLAGTVVKSCPNWHKRLSSSSELGAQHVSPHQIPKRPHLQEKDMPVAFISSCHVSCQKLKLQVRKKKFLAVRNGFTPIDKHFGEEPWDHKSSGTTLKCW